MRLTLRSSPTAFVYEVHNGKSCFSGHADLKDLGCCLKHIELREPGLLFEVNRTQRTGVVVQGK